MNISPEAWFFLVLGSIAALTATNAQLPVAGYCLRPPLLPNGLFLPQPIPGQRFPLGARLRVSCRPGYQLSGSSEVYCDNRKWRLQPSAGEPRCTPFTINPTIATSPCIRPCAPSEQCITYNGRSFCDCRPEYFRVPSRPRPYCVDRSEAIPSPEICSAVTCPPNSDCALFRGRQVCVCQAGTFLLGRTCQRIQSIVCRPTLSGNLISSPPSQTEWAVGATIRFGCTGGLVLQGERQAVCLASGNFNIPSYPVCIQPAPPRSTGGPPTPSQTTSCSNPQVPSNGGTLPAGKTVFAVGEVVTYFCNSNYILTGAQSASCQANGAFTSGIAFCAAQPPATAQPVPGVRAQCPIPIAPINGRINVENKVDWRAGDVVIYSCDPGYILSAPAVSTCQANGQFSSQPPFCNAPISCPQPNVPAGAVINSPKNIYMAGDVVSYSCNSGYTMYGQATITCQQDGSYSAPFPQCMGAGGQAPPQGTPSYTPGPAMVSGCTAPNPPVNGQILSARVVYPVNQRIYYNCNAGYNLVGAESALCQADYMFSAPAPLCIQMTSTASPSGVCTNLEVPENGFVRPEGQTSWQASELIVYDCRPGYRLEGIGTRFCQDDGTVFGAVPKCIRQAAQPYLTTTPPQYNVPGVGGGNPTLPSRCAHSLTNGYFYVNGMQVTEIPLNTPFEYRCAPGFELDGIGRNMCLENGLAVQDTPTCNVAATQ